MPTLFDDPFPIYRFPTYLPNLEALGGFQNELYGVSLFYYPKEQMLHLTSFYEEAKDSDEGFLLYPKDQISDEAAAENVWGEIQDDDGRTYIIYPKEKKPQTSSTKKKRHKKVTSISFIEVETEGEPLLVYTKDQTRTSSYEVAAMDSVGRFLEVEINGKPYLVYHAPKYQVPSSSNVALDSLPPRHLFLCPLGRINSVSEGMISGVGSTFTPSTYFHPAKLKEEHSLASFNHHPFPLPWCNNEIADQCHTCGVRELRTDYYWCFTCQKMLHKGCVESPLQINHPSHPEHALQLNFLLDRATFKSSKEASPRPLFCVCCGKHLFGLMYACVICNIVMHVMCAQKTIPFYIDRPKRHPHTLTLFLRQSSLVCNICGLINRFHLTYVSPRYNFVAHGDCIYVPQIIRISRHHHPLSFTSSLQLREWTCGVCRLEVDNRYGAFTCTTCTSIGYAVHTRCALRRDLWDGRDLEGVPEEEDIFKDVEPYRKLAEGIIHHFSHQHRLYRLNVGSIFDEKRFCQACVLPVYEGWIYSCKTCEYILHEKCAEAPRKMIHALHPHPLKLDRTDEVALFKCTACSRTSSGFPYTCRGHDCDFQLDLRCALISEPFHYQGHEHPLFLSLDPQEKPSCQVCKATYWKRVLNCIICEFIICFTCATLPYMARYKHDEHYLKFCIGEEARDSDWCEVCEKKLKMGGEEGFYTCNEYCCTTLHIHCLLGKDYYLKVGQSLVNEDIKFRVHPNYSSTRPFCIYCGLRCANPLVLVSGNDIYCSQECALDFIKKLRNM